MALLRKRKSSSRPGSEEFVYQARLDKKRHWEKTATSDAGFSADPFSEFRWPVIRPKCERAGHAMRDDLGHCQPGRKHAAKEIFWACDSHSARIEQSPACHDRPLSANLQNSQHTTFESSPASAHFNLFHAVRGNAEVGRVDVGARRRRHVLSMDDVILKPSHPITESYPSVIFGDAALSTVFEQERAVPDHLLPGFRWA